VTFAAERDGTWVLHLPMTKPLSLNDRDHWAKKAKATQQVRDDADVLARQARIPRCAFIRTTLVYEPRDKRRRDPINLIATLKAVQDGLVDAGVVPDDTPAYVETATPLIDAPNGKKGSLWVLVERLR
jgi:crossover junction endodeoxyribonuclease RusA